MKDNGLTSSYNDEFGTRYHPRKLTFMLPVRNYKVYYYWEGFGYWSSKVDEYEQDEVTLPSVDDVCYSGITPWTDTKDTSTPTYSTHGSAMWEMGEVAGIDAKEWMQDLMKELGRTVPKEMPEAIWNFFNELEEEGEGVLGDDKEIEPWQIAKWIRETHDGNPVELSDTSKTPRPINMSYGNLAKIVGKPGKKANIHQKIKNSED